LTGIDRAWASELPMSASADTSSIETSSLRMMTWMDSNQG
jgi:hypothetical protein